MVQNQRDQMQGETLVRKQRFYMVRGVFASFLKDKQGISSSKLDGMSVNKGDIYSVSATYWAAIYSSTHITSPCPLVRNQKYIFLCPVASPDKEDILKT